MPQDTPWGGFSSPRLPSIEVLNQPHVAWSSSGPLLPQPEPNYSHTTTEVSLQSPFNSIQAHVARPNNASMEGNDMPASRPQNPAALQGLWHSAPNVTQEHRSSSHEDQRGRVDNIPSKRASRKPKAPPLGETQWEQKKPYIEQLYMVEDLPLSEVIRRMKNDHEFSAT
jgi:hypothetical protein